MLAKIVSGGQTGVDRGALDAALEHGFPCGGHCPTGRRSEDGIIDARYPLTELADGGYIARTRKNVEDSDGTLVLYYESITGGTELTVAHCRKVGKPVLTVDAGEHTATEAADVAVEFIETNAIATLNVAGPRASGWADARDYAHAVIGSMLSNIDNRI